MAGNKRVRSAPACMGVQSETQTCLPLGICRERKVMVAKSGSLIKTTSKRISYFFAQGVSFDFYGKPREKKAHYNPLKYLPVTAHFLFVSTCVTKSSDPTSLSTR